MVMHQTGIVPCATAVSFVSTQQTCQAGTHNFALQAHPKCALGVHISLGQQLTCHSRACNDHAKGHTSAELSNGIQRKLLTHLMACHYGLNAQVIMQ